MCEWQWYTRYLKRVRKLINDTLVELEPFPIEITYEHDPVRAAYTQFFDIGK